MTLTVELTVNGSAAPASRYLTWTPYPAQLRVLDADGVTEALAVRVRNGTTNVGRLAFRQDLADEGEEEADLSLPADGTPVDLLLSGVFGSASTDDGDAVLEVAVDDVVVTSVPLMVRIRKDAESLTDDERDRFVSAFATLNNHGAGPFREFHAMHTEETVGEAHGLDAFLPWHRAYLLDLERELQLIDPRIAVPYWRFDQPAPKLFTADFMGAPSPTGSPPRFSAANPLTSWTILGVPGINRHPRFADPRVSAASPAPGLTVRSEVSVVKLQVDYAFEDFDDNGANLSGFRDELEGDPHGYAHTSFSGYLRVPGTAVGDPLFFLLHCNVDRIWAKWQWFRRRFDASRADTYFYRGRAGDAVATRVGHNRLDTMWPWNDVIGGERPLTAPRHPIAASPVTSGPPSEPTVGDLVDFQGQLGGAPLGFDYDDVPFEKAQS